MATPKFNIAVHPHNRYNPLIGEWVLVSPHRVQRPWKGQLECEQKKEDIEDAYDPLAPGATRSSGALNEMYQSTYVFENDFPAMLSDTPDMPHSHDELFRVEPVRGRCRVMCYGPKIDVSITEMNIKDVIKVIKTWQQESAALEKDHAWIQIFENKGKIMGCSLPHPHCQIWASSFLPNVPITKDDNQRKYFMKHRSQLLVDYLKKELDHCERLVYTNADWIVVVPFWAVWPFETMILPVPNLQLEKIVPQRITDLTENQIGNLALAMKNIIAIYDHLFNVKFPYSMGWHGAPTGEYLSADNSHWVFHGMFYPPLLRGANVKKFMVGYEMFAGPQRDITPEKAAEILRNAMNEMPPLNCNYEFFD